MSPTAINTNNFKTKNLKKNFIIINYLTTIMIMFFILVNTISLHYVYTVLQAIAAVIVCITIMCLIFFMIIIIKTAINNEEIWKMWWVLLIYISITMIFIQIIIDIISYYFTN